MPLSAYQVLIQERADLVAEDRRLIETAAQENRALTAEEQTRDDAIFARLETLGGEIAREEVRREARRAVNGGVAVLDGDGRISGGHNRGSDKPWGSMGEFLQAVAGAATPGSYIDPRLFRAGPAGANEGVPSDGGYLVEQDYSTQLLERAVEAAVLAPLCTQIEIGANSDGIEMPYIDETSRANGSRWGGVQVYWRAEADAVTATRPKFAELEVRLMEIYGIAYATDRLLADATALESIFTAAFSSEMAFKLDDAIFEGSGVGQPLGVITTGAANNPTVSQAKETGQAAASIVHRNISNMWARVRPRAKSRGQWFINSEVGPQLDELVIPAGTAAVEPRAVTYNEAGVMRIKGRPVTEIEQASALGTLGDIVFADFSRYLLIKKGGIQADQSMHVQFLTGQNTYRWRYRVNGRPMERSALTPFKGTNTQSDFVVLATRA